MSIPDGSSTSDSLILRTTIQSTNVAVQLLLAVSCADKERQSSPSMLHAARRVIKVFNITPESFNAALPENADRDQAMELFHRLEPTAESVVVSGLVFED